MILRLQNALGRASALHLPCGGSFRLTQKGAKQKMISAVFGLPRSGKSTVPCVVCSASIKGAFFACRARCVDCLSLGRFCTVSRLFFTSRSHASTARNDKRSDQKLLTLLAYEKKQAQKLGIGMMQKLRKYRKYIKSSLNDSAKSLCPA